MPGTPTGQFAESYRDIRLQVRIYLRHQFRSAVDVEEVADAAMEKLYLRWQEVNDPLAWVISVAKNLALDELRRAPAAQLEEVAGTQVLSVSTTNGADQHLNVDAILQALHLLPHPQHKAIVLAALGFTNREIAEITRSAPNSVAHYLYEGRKNLGSILQYRRRSRYPSQSVRPPGKS
jgi:RNA polymerase sigma factor (sigma-70 family)